MPKYVCVKTPFEVKLRLEECCLRMTGVINNQCRHRSSRAIVGATLWCAGGWPPYGERRFFFGNISALFCTRQRAGFCVCFFLSLAYVRRVPRIHQSPFCFSPLAHRRASACLCCYCAHAPARICVHSHRDMMMMRKMCMCNVRQNRC